MTQDERSALQQARDLINEEVVVLVRTLHMVRRSHVHAHAAKIEAWGACVRACDAALGPLELVPPGTPDPRD